MPDQDYTQAEIVRSLHAIREEVAAARSDAAQQHNIVLGMLATQRDEMNREYVKKETYDAHREADRIAGSAVTERLGKVESWVNLALKTVLIAVLMAVLGLVITTTGVYPR